MLPGKDERIDVQQILTVEDLYAKDVVRRYDGSAELSDKDRTTIVDAIVEYAIQNQIKISSEMMSTISKEICQIFPVESPVDIKHNS